MGEAQGTAYAVTELLEGETLRSALRGGPLPVRKAVEQAVQIAQGLAAAHEKGLVHRDLKPENVFVTTNGQVKILDFGLACQETPMGPVESEVQTLTRDTPAGVVLGTVGYMSPEQVQGLAVDHRSERRRILRDRADGSPSGQAGRLLELVQAPVHAASDRSFLSGRARHGAWRASG